MIFIKIVVDSLVLERPRGYTPYKEFERIDLHYKEVNNNFRGGARDGWIINHMIPIFN